MNTNRTRTALLLPTAVLAATAFAGLASPANASDVSPGGYRIDEDFVRVASTDGTSHMTDGHALAFLRNNRVQVQVHGKVHRDAAVPGCRSAKVTFVFADETTQTTPESPRACKQYGVTDKAVDFHPTKDKDVVRYHVALLSSNDLTSPATTLKSRMYEVGDAPDSYGTASRLDHDPLQLIDHTQTIFADGASDWWIQRQDIAGVTLRFARGRVQGTLVRPVGIEGQTARLQATWSYADGTSAKKLSGTVSSSTPTLRVNMTSDQYKEAVSVEIKVITDWPASSAALLTRFGDYYGR
jgi:hypothetical protein